ncbi:MAG: HEAT repeat domain-containing protein [Candidatus Poribacteria bacterium]|nr:HEAT repeat domain-containing protein [Candidatus Poribacteria bacterium]
MIRKIQLYALLSTLICLSVIGCAGENRYYDNRLQMEVQQLDSDLDNRWSTTGVVIIDVKENGPAARAKLEPGELITYVIGERFINEIGDYDEKKAMKDDNNFILKFTDGRDIRMSVRRTGDKVGLTVNGNQVSKVEPGSPADIANIKVNDTIKSVIDERNIKTIKDYKEAMREFAKYDSKVKFRTTELIGVKIAAVIALGNLGDAQAVDDLTEILENSPEISLRKPAAKSLERLVTLGHLDNLLQQFRRAGTDELPADELSQHQRESAEILGLVTVDLEENRAVLTNPFGTQFRHRSVALHQKVNTERMVELAKKYIKRVVEPDQEIRRACLSILGNLKPSSAIADLIAVMEDGEEIPGVRFQAGLTLSQIGAPAVDALIAAFKGGDASVKDIAASALGNIGGEKARNVLIDALRLTTDATIKLTVVDAIARIGDSVSIQALRKTLQAQQQQPQEDSGLGTFLAELLDQIESQSM